MRFPPPTGTRREEAMPLIADCDIEPPSQSLAFMHARISFYYCLGLVVVVVVVASGGVNYHLPVPPSL